MNKTEIILYRHKIYKDIYLIRNWNICGGTPETEWFGATKSLKKAIEKLWRYDDKTQDYRLGDLKKEIEEHFFDFEKGKSELKVKITLQKELEFDGYKGTLTKEETYPVSDFEPLILIEKEENNE